MVAWLDFLQSLQRKCLLVDCPLETMEPRYPAVHVQPVRFTVSYSTISTPLPFCPPAVLSFAQVSPISPSLCAIPARHLPRHPRCARWWLVGGSLTYSPSPTSRRIQHPRNLRSRSNKRTYRTRPWNPQPTRSRFIGQSTKTRRILSIHDCSSGCHGRWSCRCWIRRQGRRSRR